MSKQKYNITEHIEAALKEGKSLSLGSEVYSAALSFTSDPSAALAIATVEDVSLPSKPSLNNLVGLFTGSSISSLIPPTSLSLDGVTLSIESVGFILATKAEKIIEINATLGLTGKPWTVITIGEDTITLTLDSIRFASAVPDGNMPYFMASANGTASIGTELTLNVSVNFPGGSISLTQVPGTTLDMGKFFKSLGLDGMGIMDQVALSELEFSIDHKTSSFAMGGVLSPNTGSSLTLIPNVLLMQNMYFSLSHSLGDTDGTINASLLFGTYFAVDISAEMNLATHSWDFSGNINIPENAKNLSISPVEGEYAVPLSTLIEKSFGIASPNLPSTLADVAISYLLIDYSYSKSGGDANKSYTFEGAIEDSWTLDNTDMSAAVSVEIVKDASDIGNDKKEISANFTMDGFDFNLSCDLSSTTNTISATISDTIDGHNLDLSGSYSKDTIAKTNTVSLTFQSSFPLVSLMVWLVKKVAGNPYYTLPDPWGEAMHTIEGIATIPKGTSVKFKTTKKADVVHKKVDISIPINDVSILGIITIKHITLAYDSSKVKTGTSPISGLSFNITYSGTVPFLNQNPISWDPVNSQPPSVPGKGASLIDIELLALGQHVAIKGTTPTTVSSAVSHLAKAVDGLDGDETSFLKLMDFKKDAGWLVGAHAMFLGQADVKFIFDDPQMYGLSVMVNSGKNKTLNKLAGLYAEILYRKVNERVGEYEGSLTLPTKIRKMQFGNAFITLPSISVSIYTNGDFSFDIGFPYHLDFSHSFSVIADSFTGAGGFYFAKLNGLHPKSILPTIGVTDGGVFNPITEIGVGLRVGREVAFHKGPLSASASITLEVLFQGTFAKFTPNNPAVSEAEYYDIHAVIEIVGHIQGEINFAIITATLDAIAYLRADTTLVAYKQCLVAISAYVSVSITVGINLGFFTIHIHCHFSMTYQTHALIGTSSTAPWDALSNTDLSSDTFLLEGENTQETALLTWQSITALSSKLINIDIVPQPTSTEEGEWNYVAQFAINLEETGNDSYTNFVEGVLVWALYATTKPTASSSYEDALTKTVKLDALKTFSKALSSDYASVAPSIEDIQLLFKPVSGTALFSASINKAAKPSGNKAYKAAFFPTFPGTAVILKSHNSQKVSFDAEAFSELEADASNMQEGIFIEFMMLTVSNAMDKAQELGAFVNDKPSTIAYILSTLKKAPSNPKKLTPAPQSYLHSIAGLTTRFMLHGTRHQPTGDNHAYPLYTLTKQQQSFSPEADSTLSMGVYNALAPLWNMGINVILMTSASTSSLIQKPSVFMSEAPTLSMAEFTSSALMPLTHAPKAKEYALKLGVDIPPKNASSLWHLPKSLINGLSSKKVSPSNCSLYSEDIHSKTGIPKGTAPKSVHCTWLSSVELKIKKIALPTQKGEKIGYMKDTYMLDGVNALGLLQLEALIKDISYNTGSPTIKSSPITKVNLSYLGGDDKLMLNEVGSDIFLLQSNFSTQTNPPNMELEASKTHPFADFIFKLFSGGMSNSGGYYLYWKGSSLALPNGFFDSMGVAEISAVVSLTQAKPYCNALIIDSSIRSYKGKSKTKILYIADSGSQVTHACFDAGRVPVRVVREVAVPQNHAPFSSLINSLYNLLNISYNLGSQEKTISPKNSSASHPNRWHYDYVFTPLKAFVPNGTGALPEAKEYSPYYNVYTQTPVTLNLKAVDFFGNMWATEITPTTIKPITMTYTDPMITLMQLPYLHIDYSFSDSGDIELNFDFDFKGYFTLNPADSKKKQEKQRAKKEAEGLVPIKDQNTDLWAYAKALYQLSDPYVKASLTSTIATQLDCSSLMSGIVSRLKVIYAALDLNTPLLQPLHPISITASTLNTKKYFALNVKLTLSRINYVNNAFTPSSSVAQSVIQVAPHTLVDNNDKRKNDLKPFATTFEKAYSPMKIAVGAIDKTGAKPNAHQVWVVRYGDTGDLDVVFATKKDKRTPICYSYSPKPLSNKLLSRADVPVIGSTLSFTATNVDLDALMLSFLKAVDKMFTPEMMVPASIINAKAITDLTRYKKVIVDNLITYVSYSPKGSGASDALAAAKELYKQECLKLLSNFYKMDAVGVFETKKNSGFSESINILGSVVASNSSKAEASLTTLKAPLPTTNNASYMAMGVFPNSSHSIDDGEDEYASYSATLDFKVTAFEHDIQTVNILEGSFLRPYKAGSWFKFVNTPDKISIGTLAIDIPLPLRAFPTSPRLGKLSTEDLADITSPASNANEEMMYAKSWSLNGVYSHDYVAQDTLGLKVSINKKSPSHHTKALVKVSEVNDLFEALVQFEKTYPTLKPNLDKLSTDSNPSSSQTAISNAIQNFVTLVQHVAEYTWSDYTSTEFSQYLGVDDGLDPIVAHFSISEKALSDGTWSVSVKCDDKNENSLGFCPQVQIPGYKASMYTHNADTSIVYSYTANKDGTPTPEEIVERTVVLAPEVSLKPTWPFSQGSKNLPLDILSHQNAIMSMKVMRNMNLNSVFDYETAEVAYKSRLYPLLVVDKNTLTHQDVVIKIGELTGKGDSSLKGRLTNFFQALLMHYSAQTQQKNGQFQAVVSFNYPASAKESSTFILKSVSIPVTMRIPTDFSNINYIQEMQSTISEWINENYGSLSKLQANSNLSKAYFNFDISLFSGSSKSGNPILRLKHAQLQCNDISGN